jgi:hypothetical protein
MGQKIHPHGLRVGITRKWSSTWYETSSNWKSLFFYQKQLEDFFKSFFYFYPYTRKSITKRVLLVELKLFKFNARTLCLFVFFYKMRTKRRPKRLKSLHKTKNFAQDKGSVKQTKISKFHLKTLLVNKWRNNKNKLLARVFY